MVIGGTGKRGKGGHVNMMLWMWERGGGTCCGLWWKTVTIGVTFSGCLVISLFTVFVLTLYLLLFS